MNKKVGFQNPILVDSCAKSPVDIENMKSFLYKGRLSMRKF